MTDASPPFRLSMTGVRKRYGATVALDGVDLKAGAGEVHAIIGENGAGKSTLMKILAGAVQADAGEIRIDGCAFRPGSPHAARQAGIAMIHQELCLAPHLSVEANMALGIENHRAGVMRTRLIRNRAQAALDRLGCDDIDLRARVNELSPGSRQMVEIARALMTNARIMVMDEPTSSLGLHDIEQLFAVIASIKSQGVSVIYISHFLEEVARVADRYTVLRDGRVAATGAMRETSTARLVELMIGRRLDEMYPRSAHTPDAEAPAAFEARDIHGRRLPRGASLRIERGEVVGVAGLVGAGRTEMLRAIFGLDPMPRGEVLINAKHASSRSPRRNLRAGVGMLSEDRASEGLSLKMSIADNITLGGLSRVSTFGWTRPRRQREAAMRNTSLLATRMRDPSQRVGELSGGNQQKVALARLLYRDVDVLLLDEPTRGIDIGSRALIYRLIAELAAGPRPRAIIFVSSAVNELLGVCDRVVVMHRGRIVAERPAKKWTEHEVIQAAITGRDPSAREGGDAHAA